MDAGRRRRPWVATLLAAGCAAAPPGTPEPEEWDRELPPEVRLADFDEEDHTHAPVRVVADSTGEPVAGARIDNWWEADLPHVEPWENLLEQSVVTDRDGWALVRTRNRANWFHVEAPGWAPLCEMSFEYEVRLQRGVDFPLELRDWLDRPVAGATVEAVLGCGHTPNVRSGITGVDGRLVLRCIAPGENYLWIRSAGLTGRSDGYLGGWEDLPVEDGVHVLRGRPGPVVEGVVLRDDGSPAAGAIVGTRESHRGPWTVAGPGGRFRLVGALPYDRLVAYLAPPESYPEGVEVPQTWFQSVPGVFHTVRILPAEEDEEGRKDPAPRLLVRVGAVDGRFASGKVRVVLVREGDGLAEVGHAEFRDGVAEESFEVEPGQWTLTAGDPAGRFRPASKRVEVTGAETDISFVLAANPTWNTRVLVGREDGTTEEVPHLRQGTFFVATVEGIVEATPSVADDGSIHIPAAGPFAVEYREKDGRTARAILEAPPAAAEPPLVLPPPVRVPEGPPEETPRDGDSPATRLAVLLPDGRPAAGAHVTFSGFDVRGQRDLRFADLDADGGMGIASTRLNRVEVEVIEEEGLFPLVAALEGPGPWTLRWPSTEVLVRAADEAGAALPEFAVVAPWDLDFPGIDAEDGVVRIRGAPSGPLRLWVDAPGRRARDLRIVVGPGERREVVVRMNPR